MGEKLPKGPTQTQHPKSKAVPTGPSGKKTAGTASATAGKYTVVASTPTAEMWVLKTRQPVNNDKKVKIIKSKVDKASQYLLK